MTVENATYRADYMGNGLAVNFPVPFYFLENSHLKVILTDESVSPPAVAVLVLDSDYTVTGADDPEGGSITLGFAPAATSQITILRDVPYTQETNYVNNDPFLAETHETALDKLTMLVQELAEKVNRCLKLGENEALLREVQLPLPDQREGKYLSFDPYGQPVMVEPPPGVAIFPGAVGTFAGIPDGIKNSVNRDFTLTHGGVPLVSPPIKATIYKNIPLIPGVGYTLLGTTITYTVAPDPGDDLYAEGIQIL